MSKRYYRYNDLVAAGIIANRTTLARWIRDNGFPRGVPLGKNTRAWLAAEVDEWLEARAAEREIA